MPQSLANRPPETLAASARPPGFFDGTMALFSGFGFVLTTPSVWPLALVPVVVALGLTGLLSGAVIALISPRIMALVGPHWRILGTVVEVVAGAFSIVLAALIGFGLAQPLSGPALNRIVRRSEAAVGAPAWPPTGFVEDVVRALGSILIAYAFGLPILALLFAVNFVFPPAAIVTFPLKLIVIAVLIAWDLCDYPLSLRGMSVGERVAFVKRNLRAVLGFGLGLAALSLLPCMLLLVLPAGVAGAARLTVAIERAEASRRS